MNYTEVYVNAKTTLCKAIAERIPDEYLDINCPDPLNCAKTFIGVYKSKHDGTSYIASQFTDGTVKSDSIYELSVDQAYEVLKTVMVASNTSKNETYTVEIRNGDTWTEVLKTHSYRIAQIEYWKRCKSWPEVRLQRWS
jgi:hypothetical protein